VFFYISTFGNNTQHHSGTRYVILCSQYEMTNWKPGYRTWWQG